MSNNNLSQQQFQLYFEAHRGVASHPERLDTKDEVGMHWSTDKGVAKDFAVHSVKPGQTKPYILHAQIPVGSVDTDTERLNDYKVGGKKYADEREVPVELGKRMLITGKTTLREGKEPDLDTRPHLRYTKSRTRTYNPPREATA